MRNSVIIKIIFFSILFFSCKEKERIEQKSISETVEILEPKIDLKVIESNFIEWWTYYSHNIFLSSNFIGLNVQLDTISKKQFIEELITTNYIPLKIKSDSKDIIYKLFRLDSEADKNIGITIKNEALTSLKHFEMEGDPFPKFEFIDLKERIYNNENTKGKIIILKTWFVGCQVCVAEFPELNKLVESYKNRKDIVFISLALDSKPELENFLQKKDFKYKVVPNQEKFIKEQLDLQIFPTHLIVDKNGVILKVVNKASELITFLEKERI